MPSKEEVYRQVQEHLSNLVGWGGQYADKIIAAGGCVRDCQMNLPEKVKDIDIYVQDQPMVVFNLRQAFSPNNGWQGKALVPEKGCAYLDFPNVCAIWEFWKEGYLPVQIIVVKDYPSHAYILHQHDFGFCQIGWTLGEPASLYTAEFLIDQNTKTFTIRRCGSTKQYWRTIDRYRRLLVKYPGWKLDTSKIPAEVKANIEGD